MEKFTFERYNFLTSFYPFFVKDAQQRYQLFRNFEDVIQAYPKERILDVTSIIELLSKNYLLGDRTIVKGIMRSPWMGKLNSSADAWEYASVPDHNENLADVEEIAVTLFGLLCEELLEFLTEKRNIGILLSGGMDSRIVAGVLDYLIKTGALSGVHVCALTWGNEDSRDVQYARRIAKRLNWEWKHFTVGAEELWENLCISATRGAEYSGIHLHAIPAIAKTCRFDAVLAGSYGDSIGRAEYSGVKVQNIVNLTKGIKNDLYLIKDKVYKTFKGSWNEDVTHYHKLFPQKEWYQQFEQDYQLHYMRRMLNACMDLIGERMPFYQLFTNPKVFGYMWSLHPKVRTDEVYANVLNLFATDLSDIPWARTGLQYGVKTGTPDSYKKKHHSYLKYLTYDLHSLVEKELLDFCKHDSGVFNSYSIRGALKLSNQNEQVGVRLLERLSAITSIAMCIKKYDIKMPDASHNVSDLFYGLISFPAQYKIRKIVKMTGR
jgi:hypothetical protein